jgi:hypothetical protein
MQYDLPQYVVEFMNALEDRAKKQRSILAALQADAGNQRESSFESDLAQPSGVTSKPAIRGHFKTGQRNRTQNKFCFTLIHPLYATFFRSDSSPGVPQGLY